MPTGAGAGRLVPRRPPFFPPLERLCGEERCEEGSGGGLLKSPDRTEVISMPRLPDHVIDEIRARVDIVDVVSERVKLMRSGRRYRGLCPFHAEKTPSFYVDPEKQLYHCFGCQAGGDIFRFVMDLEKATFGEALKKLAERAGISAELLAPSPEAARQAKEREALYRAVETAAAYFVKCLFSRKGEPARAYLKKRGLTEKSVRAFRLGYASPEWHDLERYLEEQGIAPELAHKAGLLGRSERGYYDWMRDRVIFPITDHQGRVVGFGGRTISGDKAKYVNSPESPIFSKRNNLYGLHVAKEALRKTGRVVIVEGDMDVVGLFEKGFTPAVASLGTAFTEEQAKLVKRFAGEAYLAYDADKAGEAAALRGLDILEREGVAVRVVRLPEGEDPDSFIRSRGLAAFNERIAEAVPLVEYKIEVALDACDVSTVEGRVKATRRVLPVLAGIESPVAREGYISQVAGRLGVTVEALAAELDQFLRGPQKGARHNLSRARYTIRDFRPGIQARTNSGPRPGANRALLSAERDLLAYVLREPRLAAEVAGRLGTSPFSAETYNSLFRMCLAQGERRLIDEALTSQIEDPKLAQTARSLLNLASGPAGPLEAYVGRVATEKLRSRVKGLEQKLTHLLLQDHVSPAGISQLVREYKRLRAEVYKTGGRPKAS